MHEALGSVLTTAKPTTKTNKEAGINSCSTAKPIANRKQSVE